MFAVVSYGENDDKREEQGWVEEVTEELEINEGNKEWVGSMEGGERGYGVGAESVVDFRIYKPAKDPIDFRG